MSMDNYREARRDFDLHSITRVIGWDDDNGISISNSVIAGIKRSDASSLRDQAYLREVENVDPLPMKETGRIKRFKSCMAHSVTSGH
jgi:hypothetical protein